MDTGKVRSNRIFLAIVIILVQILWRGPDLYHAVTVPPGRWFTGQASWFDPWDINVYLSAINWGRRGQVSLENVYDPLVHDRVWIYTPYTVTGFISRSLPLSAGVLFHLLAIATSACLIVCIWHWTGVFFSRFAQRRVALVLTVLGGGLGWVPPLTRWGIDFNFANFTLYGALRSPHEAIALICFGSLMVTVYRLGSVPWRRSWLPIGLAAVGLLLIHPYMLAVVGVVLGYRLGSTFITTNNLDMQALFMAGLIGGLTVVYYFCIGRPFYRLATFYQVSHQQFDAFSIPEILVGFGLLLVGLVAGYRRKPTRATRFLWVWFVLQLAATFIPPYRRLFFAGLYLPAGFLAVSGLGVGSSPRRAALLSGRSLILAACLISSVYIFSFRLSRLKLSPWVTKTADEGQIYTYLASHGPADTGVLGYYPTANLVPVVTDKRGFVGHIFQTPDSHPQWDKLTEFLRGDLSVTAAGSLLSTNHVGWVIWGPAERERGQRTDFPYPSLVEPVLALPQANLYRTLTD